MRLAIAFLLLLVLPAMLVPAGMHWRVCQCQAMRSHEASCCHQPATAPARACCAHREATPRPAAGLPAARAKTCGCVWLALPDLDPAPVRGDTPLAALPVTPPDLPTAFAAAPVTAVPGARVWRSADDHHPPPGTARTLPLRL